MTRTTSVPASRATVNKALGRSVIHPIKIDNNINNDTEINNIINNFKKYNNIINNEDDNIIKEYTDTRAHVEQEYMSDETEQDRLKQENKLLNEELKNVQNAKNNKKLSMLQFIKKVEQIE